MAVPQMKKREQQLNIETITWGDLTWVDIEQPTERETEYLAQNYPFHPLDLDDCLSRIQRAKIDEYENYLFLIFHFQVFNKQTRVSSLSQISVFIGENYLITLHGEEPKPLVKLFRQCQIDEESRQEYFSQGPGYILYRIIDRMVDAYFPILNKILSLIEDTEDKVFDEKVETAKELSILRRDIITQRRIIFPLRIIMTDLESKVKPFTKMDMSVYWGDLMDHINKICETLDECKETIEVFKDTDYLLATYRLNRLSRILTILGAIILPFLVISSIYGMNIPLPGGLEKDHLQSFLLILITMSVIAGVMLYVFRRRRWI